MNQKILEEGVTCIKRELHHLRNTQFVKNKEFIQHGTTTLYEHCVSVAYRSVILAAQFNIKVDMKALVRGSLLHDYYLYDWHNCKLFELHGFHHPRIAWENATRDFKLSKKEQDIIRKHMFPLTIYIPRYKESWIVTVADKLCSTQETLKMKPHSKKRKSHF